MASPPATAGARAREPAEDRGGQGRHDEERVGAGDERHERGDEDPGQAGDHGADRPVGHGDPLGREPGDQRPHLGLGRGPGGEPEPGEPVDAAQDERRPPRSTTTNHTRPLMMRRSPSSQVVLARIGSTMTWAPPTWSVIAAVNSTITPIDATALAAGGVVAHRPEHHEVQQDAEHRLDGEGEDAAPTEAVIGRRGRRSREGPGSGSAARPAGGTRRCRRRGAPGRRWRS